MSATQRQRGRAPRARANQAGGRAITCQLERILSLEVNSLHQRATIAMALSCNPQLIIADEPTTALDVAHQERILTEIRRIADQGDCVVGVFHDLNSAAHYADRLVLLDQGDVSLENTISASQFALFCSPAVNLFPKRCDRIHLDDSVHEHHLIPDRTRPMDFEVHRVDGVTGYLLPPREIDRLADRLVTLLLGPMQSDRMGREGQSVAAKMFSVERMISDLDDLYRVYAR